MGSFQEFLKLNPSIFTGIKLHQIAMRLQSALLLYLPCTNVLKLIQIETTDVLEQKINLRQRSPNVFIANVCQLKFDGFRIQFYNLFLHVKVRHKRRNLT